MHSCLNHESKLINICWIWFSYICLLSSLPGYRTGGAAIVTAKKNGIVEKDAFVRKFIFCSKCPSISLFCTQWDFALPQFQCWESKWDDFTKFLFRNSERQAKFSYLIFLTGKSVSCSCSVCWNKLLSANHFLWR